MTRAPAGIPRRAAPTEVRAALEAALGRRLARFEVRPSPYASSHPLDEIDAETTDGERLALVFKDCGATTAAGRRTRPRSLLDPGRPIAVHHRLLPHAPPGPPRLVAAVEDPVRERWWLFMERVDGTRLAFVGEMEGWRDAARWLASFHARFADGIDPDVARRLLVHDAGTCRRWLARALSGPRGAALGPVADRWEGLVERVAALPVTLLHGEFYADNVLVVPGDGGWRICPVDWETAAIGPGLLDLAALVSGSWDELARRDLALAYRDALATASGETSPVEAFLAGLELCRILVAVQWLGRLGPHVPPPWQRHDWLDEALSLVTRALP